MTRPYRVCPSGGRLWPGQACAAAYSFIELITVLGLVAILVALALPGYLNYTSHQKALAAARTLAADLRVARQEAVTRRLPVSVTFSAADHACAPATTPSYTIGAWSTVIKRACMGPDVEWSAVPARRLVFDAVGGVKAQDSELLRPGDVTLKLRGVRTKREYAVTVQVETGNVRDDFR